MAYNYCMGCHNVSSEIVVANQSTLQTSQPQYLRMIPQFYQKRNTDKNAALMPFAFYSIDYYIRVYDYSPSAWLITLTD